MNFEDDRIEAGEVGNLGQISELAKELVTRTEELEDLENIVKNRKKELRALTEETLPNALLEIGLSEVKLDSGVKIETKQFYRASIPKAREEEAFNWLRDNGHGDLVKHVVAVRFDRENDDAALALVKDLEDQGLQPEDKSSVHTMTLRAWVREQIEAGEEIPQDLLGVYVGQQATIKKK